MIILSPLWALSLPLSPYVMTAERDLALVMMAASYQPGQIKTYLPIFHKKQYLREYNKHAVNVIKLYVNKYRHIMMAGVSLQAARQDVSHWSIGA
jgi:hypothetical protein